jgi:exopolyphosphatase/guanosine-5'-triphosphate,3'-diphosphate pyrophosphatase
MLLASIDIGTNTFRLLIGDVHKKEEKFMINELHSERVITRLGEGVSDNNLLKKEGIDRGIKTLKAFSSIISSFNVSGVSAIGTSVLRVAKNKDVFVNRAWEEADIDIKIVNEEEEARLTALGMTMDIPVPESALLIDIGGGSTELIFMKSGRISSIKSLKLGVVYLTEQHMKKDPPSIKELMMMERGIMKELEGLGEIKVLFRETVSIGTAGTITTLSAMLQGLDRYDRKKIHKSTLSLDAVKRVYKEISQISMKKRAELYPVLLDRRMDIIVPGVLILKLIMVTFGFKEIMVSDYGLREGIIIDLYTRIKGCE